MNKLRWTFSLKLFISTALITLLSILLISFFSFNKYSTSIMKQSSEKVQQIVDMTGLNIQTYLDDLYRLSLSPYYNQQVMDALEKSTDDSDLQTLYKTRTIEDFLEQILIIPRNDILRVFILTDKIYKGERIPSTIARDLDFNNFRWYQESLSKTEPIFISAHLEEIIENPKNIVLSIVSSLKSTKNTNKSLGVIKVDANYSGISDICNKVNFGKGGGVFIIDSNHKTIFSNVPSLNDNECADVYSKAQNNSNLLNIIKFNNKHYLINYTNIEYANWTIIGVTSLATINDKIINVRNSAFLVALICFLFSILVIIFYLNMYLRPLNKIVHNIHKIRKGNLNVVFNVDSNDELGYLSTSLNEMVSELRNMFHKNDILVHQIYEAKYLQKEAQISSLFSQIQPHFIYNTLNMISMLVQSNSLEQAVTNINKLSIILRGLTHLDKEIPVATELDLLDAYLTIQKNRYTDRLDYNIDVDESYNDYIIPSLLLQPIVENSVIHGCEAKKDTTTIYISSCVEDTNIAFIIRDNGVGMNNKTLELIRAKLLLEKQITSDFNLTKKGNGIALINVNKRIKIKYGNQYGLMVDSEEGVGTTVKVILPKTPIEEVNYG
ncbi:MAG: histidine kinase [Vallitalea sp.]|jgi:two-component system sensor histidine kinase YesM|nr:histidine kinase [Vallitalea sp.]